VIDVTIVTKTQTKPSQGGLKSKGEQDMKDATQDNASDKVQIEVTRAELCMILDGLCSDVDYVDDPMECSGIVNHHLAKEMDVLHDAIITNLKEDSPSLVLFDDPNRGLIADDDDDDDPEDNGIEDLSRDAITLNP